MKYPILKYGNIRLLDVMADQLCDIDITGATHVRLTLPAGQDKIPELIKQGYVFADRTLGVSINLLRSKIDFEQMVRINVEESCEYKPEILSIAKKSFGYDRRFHILPKLEQKIASVVLEDWVDQLDNVLICKYKENVAGFLALKETAPDVLFVHLAAVKEEYRMTGAAMSLYAKAALLAIERGYKKLDGRISSQNTAVMNLYVYLGGVFSHPMDIYLKEI